MALTETELKTRLGLILQGVLAEAIRQAGYTLVQDYQYDPTCERPDFLIPNHTKPRYMIEVHQTEARNSFQMKTLRAFTAVTEAKAHYGEKVVSVNVLFGDPDRELPASNLRALCGIFDVNLVPRKDASDKTAIARLEAAAAAAAADEEYTKRTGAAIEDVIRAHSKGVATLKDLVSKTLTSAKARPELFPMWRAERARVSKLAPAPKASSPTFYKRGLLGSLFLSDDHFAELILAKNADKCSLEVQRQLVAAKLATVSEEIDGDHITLEAQFQAFANDPEAARLRAVCKAELDSIGDLHWFFEDIRDSSRRVEMACAFVGLAKEGRTSLIGSIVDGLKGNAVGGVEHARCWPADLLALLTGHSQNDFNRRMVQSGRDPENYQYPFNHISGRFERLVGCPDHFEAYATFAVDVFEEICLAEKIGESEILAAESWLPDAILKLRLDGAIKLQKFNPLYACTAEICAEYGVEVRAEKIKSIAFDLAGGKGRLGKYDALVLEYGGKQVLSLAVAVHDQNGDHKSKEWGARRLATLYRYEEAKILRSEFDDGLFVLDGEWEDKDVARLYRSGWNHICRLGDLETTLKYIFGLKGKAKGRRRPRATLVFESDEDAG